LRSAPRKSDCLIEDRHHRRSGKSFIPSSDRLAL
jgi:hypothetical protein